MWRFFLKKQSKLINNVLILKNNNNNNKCIIKYVKHCKNDNNIHFQRQITRTLSTTMPGPFEGRRTGTQHLQRLEISKYIL